jgi:hypothetical protein
VLGEMDSDPVRDKADHTLGVLADKIDPIYQSSSDFDSENGSEVYMVG